MGACNSGTQVADPRELPLGTRDVPGYAALPGFSPLLFVGNERAAARGNFDVVISTCTPKDLQGRPAAQLSTHNIHFDDQAGREKGNAVEVARRCIVEAAGVTEDAIRKGKKTLVHCEWGQNRSGAIVCAYAVLYAGWPAEEAIKYMRECNRRDRRYDGQKSPGGPMHNQVFNQIIRELEADRSKLTNGKEKAGGRFASLRFRVRRFLNCCAWCQKS